MLSLWGVSTCIFMHAWNNRTLFSGSIFRSTCVEDGKPRDESLCEAPVFPVARHACVHTSFCTHTLTSLWRNQPSLNVSPLQRGLPPSDHLPASASSSPIARAGSVPQACPERPLDPGLRSLQKWELEPEAKAREALFAELFSAKNNNSEDAGGRSLNVESK